VAVHCSCGSEFSARAAQQEHAAEALRAEVVRLDAVLVAIGAHGKTLWADSSMGSGRPAGQMLTSECHGEVIEHLVGSALAGRSLAEAADDWARLFPRAVRLDEAPGRSGRRGPDGRPL
jgi:hypothetical protein